MRRSPAWHLQDSDLHAYAGGGLAGPLLWSVEAHLGACASCRDRLHGCVAQADPQLVEDGWARLDASLDAAVPGPVERLLLLLGVPDHTARLLAATPALRLSWLVAVALTLAMTATIARLADPIVFLAAAPLLPLIGVAVSFGPGIDPTYEMALVAPMQSFRLLLLRCVTVVSANTVLCALASLAVDAGLAAAGWFLPSLALTVLTLLLAPRFGTVIAACAVGVGWACLVAALTGALFTTAGQSGTALAAVLAAAVLARRASAFDTSRFRRIR
ncbi:zf-HC2 domain-containing protein [Dactylosporangium siamense]|uniref:Putative zinc-finger domain-containing protein n=1 Tax=Dactylosporangium siamense TaxID=685454 RepID=A0A919U962_9ACTN|nr:zf-HC2 domain-containing protein [Dactylosporangium siamense]GIG43450.1 hypothetical protein Dsi01nite_014910 [Dactylosporangium siamense]